MWRDKAAGDAWQHDVPSPRLILIGAAADERPGNLGFFSDAGARSLLV